MSFQGQQIFDHLNENLVSDPGASSHWQKYHDRFEFTGNGFKGVEGFGGRAQPPNVLSRFVHRALQRPYRAMGAHYPGFEAIDALADRITSAQGRDYNLDVLRQAISLSMLLQFVTHADGESIRACVIGDGFATMTSLLVESRAAAQVVLVNLSKTLMVDLWYLRKLWGSEAFFHKVRLVTDLAGYEAATMDNEVAVIAVEARNSRLLSFGSIGLAVNIASMQEMDPPVIAEYFRQLRASSLKTAGGTVFYCCNRVEKRLPDGTMVRFSEYPWREGDAILMDEDCPWHQTYYTARPPFFRPYDGPIKHRVARLTHG